MLLLLGIVSHRFKFLWNDVVLVTDPAALASIMGRGENAVDKAFETYAPINKMCDPHGQVGSKGWACWARHGRAGQSDVLPVVPIFFSKQ